MSEASFYLSLNAGVPQSGHTLESPGDFYKRQDPTQRDFDPADLRSCSRRFGERLWANAWESSLRPYQFGLKSPTRFL